MECDDGDPTQSILPLSQHAALLQSEQGGASSCSPSSSTVMSFTQTMDNKSQQQWLLGASASSSYSVQGNISGNSSTSISPLKSNNTHISTSSSSHFTAHPVSMNMNPGSTPNSNACSPSSSHQMISPGSSSASKYYRHSNVISSGIIPQIVPYGSSSSSSTTNSSSTDRPEYQEQLEQQHRFVPLSPTNFSEVSDSRVCLNSVPAVSTGFQLKATMPANSAGAVDSNVSTSTNAANNSNSDDDIGQYYYYQDSSRNSSSMNFYGSRSLESDENGNGRNLMHSTKNRGSHHLDTAGQTQAASLDATGGVNYQHIISSADAEGLGKISTHSHMINSSNNSSRHRSHANVDEVMEFTQSVLDPRPKLLNSFKSQSDGYHVGKCAGNLGPDLSIMPSATGKRQVQENDLVIEFDFSLASRDFGAVPGISNGRADYVPYSRSSGVDLRLSQDQPNDFLHQDPSLHKYPSSSSQSQSSDTIINNNRKVPAMLSDFPGHQSLVPNTSYTSPNKSANGNFGSTDVQRHEVSSLRLSDSHKYSRDYKKLHFLKEESQQHQHHHHQQQQQQPVEQFVSESSVSTVEEKWSGRSRAHRKMARLLGQGPSCKEKSQDNILSSFASATPSYQAFPKKSQDMVGYGTALPEMHNKPLEAPKSYSLSEPNGKDLPIASTSSATKNIDRSVNIIEPSVAAAYDRREDEEEAIGRSFNPVRDYNIFPSHGVPPPATALGGSLALIPKESSTTLAASSSSNQQFYTTTNAPPSLDLEFQQPLTHRDLDLNPQLVLQVSKDLDMEENLADTVTVNPELFSHHVDPHQMNQTNFPFTDNTNSQYSQEISLESYLIPVEKDNSGNVSKKMISYYNQRNLVSEAEFNIEEYMEGQADKDLTHAYGKDNVPQDMTMYQKISPEKAAVSSYTKFKEREVAGSQNFKTGAASKHNKSSNISELQKELTKSSSSSSSSSSKESKKGVRIPRDIPRAMEYLQDLQETEKEEEEKRKREKQQNNEIHNDQSQQQQQQQLKFQPSTSGINSSPKKTFQNKHQIESMSAITEQQLLSMPASFMEDQSMDNVNFLDQPGYCFPDQSTAAPVGLCDPSVQEISQYSGFPSLYPQSTLGLDIASSSSASSSNKQREYQQSNTGYLLNPDLDYHILKRLAFSAASAKDLDTTSISSSLQQHPSMVTPWLTGYPPIPQADTADLNFNLGIQRLPEHLALLNDCPPPSLPSPPPLPSISKFPSNPSTMENVRSGQNQNHVENLNYADTVGTSDQRGMSCLDSDKFQNFPSSSFLEGSSNLDSSLNVLPSMDLGLDKVMALDILEASRQSLYVMMKQEQLCDAILSTANVEVKVHQSILCSMSQFLCNRLLLPAGSSSQESIPTSPKTGSSSSSSTTTSSFSQPYPKDKDGSHANSNNSSSSSNLNSPRHHHHHHHIVMLVINCDNIKSSSISAFLMFIYLGKTEFNESNVLDLFILASSLHVSTLKSLCLQFMWQTHISGDGLTIPPVQISKRSLSETRDQACYANLGKMAQQTEDKSVYANLIVENADAASQTDQTMCKVGRGGQDEWVMLKKTKQKTVSPSKSKMNLTAKGSALQDNNNTSLLKAGKKSWLSPKRRFKSELLAQAKNDSISLTKIKDKEVVADCSDSLKSIDGIDRGDGIHDLNQLSDKLISSDRNVTVGKHPQMIASLDTGGREVADADEVNAVNQNVRHIKTTVEIAEEAAAAKLSASSASKSGKKGDRIATTAHSHSSVEVSSHGQPGSNSFGSEPVMSNNVDNYDKCPYEKMSICNTNTVSIEKPVKKKIAQLTLNNKSSNNEINMNSFEVPMNTSPKKMELHSCNKGQSSDEKSTGDGTVRVAHSNCLGENPSVGEGGDLSQVSCFIDSIVKKMGTDTEDAELQKVIHDLNSELNRPPIPATVTGAPCSSVALSSSSSSSPPSARLIFTTASSSPLCSTATTTSTAMISTTCAPSTPLPAVLVSSSKSKSAAQSTTAQGFRKRLIQLVKSENLKLSSSPSSSVPSLLTPPVSNEADLSQSVQLRSENCPVATATRSNSGVASTHLAAGNGKTSDLSAGNGKTLDLVARDGRSPNLAGRNGKPPDLAEGNGKTPDLAARIEKTPDLAGRNGKTPDLAARNEKTPVFAAGDGRSPDLAAGNGKTPDLAEVERELSQSQLQHTKEMEIEANSSDRSKETGLADDYDTHFLHKIFKRKRKTKPRKIVTSDSDNQARCPKPKTKKTSSGSELEGALTKARLKRNVLITTTTTTTPNTTSDSETSVASTSARTKGRKAGVNDSSKGNGDGGGGGAIQNVRPPPKKRAKMERELMKVRTNDDEVKVVDRNKKDERDKDAKDLAACVDEKDKVSDKDDQGETKSCGVGVDGGNIEEKKTTATTKSVEKNAIVIGVSRMREAVLISGDGELARDSKMATTIATEGNKNEPKPTVALPSEKSKPASKTIKKRKCMDGVTSEATTAITTIKKLPKPTEKRNCIVATSTATAPTKNDNNNMAKSKTCQHIPPPVSSSSSSASTLTFTIAPLASERTTRVEDEFVLELQERFKLSGLQRRIFSCRLCKSHLKSALLAVKHSMTVHKLEGDDILGSLVVGLDENKHEACDICGYVTKDVTYKYMHYHKYFQHSVPLPAGLSTHKCELCTREFQTSYQLSEHVKGHDKDFSFTCWTCGQSFKSRNSLNNHVFHKHSKLRKHVCRVCDKAFKTWTQLKIHIRIHTGECPFTCVECGYGSATQGNMRHHLIHKHKMGKEEVDDTMAKINEKKSEMTPKALDELMDRILSKALPDKAQKVCKRKERTKKTTEEENCDKSSGEENIKTESRTKNKNAKLIRKVAKSVLNVNTKTALKEKISGNCNKLAAASPSASTTNCGIALDLSFDKSKAKYTFLLPKIERNVSSESPPPKSSGNDKCQPPSSSSSILHSTHQKQRQQQRQQHPLNSFTIISHPISANGNNIVVIPPSFGGTTGTPNPNPIGIVALTTANTNIVNASTTSIIESSSSSNLDSNSVTSSTISPSYTPVQVINKALLSDDKSVTYVEENEGQKTVLIESIECNNDKNSSIDASSSNTREIPLASLSSSQQIDNKTIVILSSPPPPPQQQGKQCGDKSAAAAPSNEEADPGHHLPAADHHSLEVASIPTVLPSSSMAGTGTTKVFSFTPHQLQLLHPQPVYDGISSIVSSGSGHHGHHGLLAAANTNFVYASGGMPIVLINPMVDGMMGVNGANAAGGGDGSQQLLTTLTHQQQIPFVTQTHDVSSGLVQIVPMPMAAAATQGSVPASVDLPSL